MENNVNENVSLHFHKCMKISSLEKIRINKFMKASRIFTYHMKGIIKPFVTMSALWFKNSATLYM